MQAAFRLSGLAPAHAGNASLVRGLHYRIADSFLERQIFTELYQGHCQASRETDFHRAASGTLPVLREADRQGRCGGLVKLQFAAANQFLPRRRIPDAARTPEKSDTAIMGIRRILAIFVV